MLDTYMRKPLPLGVGLNDDEEQPINAVPLVAPEPTKAEPAPINAAPLGPVKAAPIEQPKAQPLGDSAQRYANDKARQDYLINSRSGIDQMTRPVDAQGNPTGAHVGVGKKILAGLARVGDIAGSAFFPGIMENIPGTTLHHRELVNDATARVANDLGNMKTEADIQGISDKAEHQNEMADVKQKQLAAQLAQHGFKMDQTGNVIPLSYEEMSQEQQAVHDLKVSQQEVADATAALKKAQASNMPLQIQMAQQRIATAQQNARTAAGRLGLSQQEFEANYLGTHNGEPLPGVQQTPEGKPIGPKVASASNKVQSDFDKSYVKPARDVEKSYQMMDQAYKEYQDAKKQGKDLPTGAQSMLALSTHLSTTFGNVKGARITRDMIMHHLGARSVGDDAVVAVQKLTNGDALSPAQWKAFHDLVKQSRDLSWKGATDEAQRKGLKVDFLPPDLQGGGAQQGTGQPKPTHRFNPQTGRIEEIH